MVRATTVASKILEGCDGWGSRAVTTSDTSADKLRKSGSARRGQSSGAGSRGLAPFSLSTILVAATLSRRGRRLDPDDRHAAGVQPPADLEPGLRLAALPCFHAALWYYQPRLAGVRRLDEPGQISARSTELAQKVFGRHGDLRQQSRTVVDLARNGRRCRTGVYDGHTLSWGSGSVNPHLVPIGEFGVRPGRTGWCIVATGRAPVAQPDRASAF